MNDKIFKYLDSNFKIENGKVIDKFLSINLYGEDILKEIFVIFSLDNDVLKKIIKEWVLTNSPNENIEKLWRKPSLNNFVEPKMGNRFLIYFPEYFNIPEWAITKASRPRLNIFKRDIFPHNNDLTQQFYEWADLELKLIDPISPSSTQALNNLVRNNTIHENIEITLEMLDPTGIVVERWLLTDCFIKSIDFGSLSYSSNNLAEITLTISINQAVLLF